MAFSESLRWVYVHLSFWDIAFALLGLFLFSCFLQRMTNKGPMLWPVMGLIPSVMININDIYDWITMAFIETQGTFPYRGMWMGGAHGIVTVDPSKIEYMLKTRSKNFPKGKYYRERFRDLLGDGIFNADDELWQQQRKVATIEMHSSRFVRYSLETMQDLVQQKLLKLINKLVNSRGTIDLQELLLRFTFDNICSAALGVDSGCLALDLPEVPFAKAFEEATELTLFRFLVPHFVWKPMKLFGLGFEKRLKEATKFVHDFAEKIVVDRRSEFAKLGSLNARSDLLSRLMDNNNTDDQQKLFSNKYLRDFCISFILAGRDTSSVGLAWFFWLVTKNPEIESKILVEINEILSRREAKDHGEILSETVFTVEELKQMVYLQAALTESLRLYPPVPIDIKEVTNDDVFPDGTVVKKGARILYCMFSMARMVSIWGKDCLEFKPERWIQKGQFVSENQFKYAVFNGGPRLCLGKSFAYMQMKMIAASILLRYRVKILEVQDVVPKVTTTLYMKNGLLVSFKPRLVNCGTVL
ncbi:Cytochrome P450, E-class, group I [Parasponia andersonii]|uniref:Cytochrome P450, E-class, group I n=1 Tax=Parasponia andersonii TaxID=3476 RepID=A0A2P5B0M9_PARAD|nr:Cytochrome P450, E-class, group I [Parasponia andersonii]